MLWETYTISIASDQEMTAGDDIDNRTRSVEPEVVLKWSDVDGLSCKWSGVKC